MAYNKWYSVYHDLKVEKKKMEFSHQHSSIFTIKPLAVAGLPQENFMLS